MSSRLDSRFTKAPAPKPAAEKRLLSANDAKSFYIDQEGAQPLDFRDIPRIWD
jgi:hypothetical protein